MIRVYTAGIFDMLHVGHVRFLEKAKAQGDILIVGVVTDEVAGSYKRTPIIEFDQRAELVASLKVVDQVIPAGMTKDLSEEFYRTHKIDVHCNGDDPLRQEPGKYKINYGEQTYALPISLGIMKFLPYSPITSTSEILERVRERFAHTPQS